MYCSIPIKDHAIWFKDIGEPGLLNRLSSMAPDETITLEVDKVVGHWLRMKNGADGRPTFGIRPNAEMKTIWNNWFKDRKGEFVEIREAQLADEYLASASALFSEWESPEDERAFSDL